jgi:hypothetical protein
MKTNRFTIEQIIKAIKKHGGLVYAAARSLDCSPTTIYNYAKRYASVQEALDNEKGLILDVTEGALIGAIKRGEGWAVTFMLRTQGKKRGYGDEVRHKVGGDAENETPIKTESTVKAKVTYDEFSDRFTRLLLGVGDDAVAGVGDDAGATGDQ